MSEEKETYLVSILRSFKDQFLSKNVNVLNMIGNVMLVSFVLENKKMDSVFLKKKDILLITLLLMFVQVITKSLKDIEKLLEIYVKVVSIMPQLRFLVPCLDS